MLGAKAGTTPATKPVVSITRGAQLGVSSAAGEPSEGTRRMRQPAVRISGPGSSLAASISIVLRSDVVRVICSQRRLGDCPTTAGEDPSEVSQVWPILI